MRECFLYEKLDAKNVKCTGCAHYCHVSDGNRGICGVRKNVGGKLQLLVYGKAAAVNVDPIEKKPLFHFLPGTSIFSIGTLGCNLGCSFCQNWEMSQATRNGLTPVYWGDEWSSAKIVAEAVKHECPSIAFTYNEPSIFFEYAFDTGMLGKKKGLKSVFVSNGFSSKESVKKMKGFLDANNIDLKSFSNEFYQTQCKARLEPVLETIVAVRKAGIWVEVTTLLIPGKNDSKEEIKNIASFLAGVDENIPWHVTAFHPEYKMLDVPSTRVEKLLEAREIGLKAGLKFVYVGNVLNAKGESTFCPNCKKLLIERSGFSVRVVGLENGKCVYCGEKIPGVWK